MVASFPTMKIASGRSSLKRPLIWPICSTHHPQPPRSHRGLALSTLPRLFRRLSSLLLRYSSHPLPAIPLAHKDPVSPKRVARHVKSGYAAPQPRRAPTRPVPIRLASPAVQPQCCPPFGLLVSAKSLAKLIVNAF